MLYSCQIVPPNHPPLAPDFSEDYPLKNENRKKASPLILNPFRPKREIFEKRQTMAEADVYYCGGTSFGNGLGPQNLILFTPHWTGMFDCGVEFQPWPGPRTDLSGFHFNSERERRMVEVIVKEPENGLREFYRTWTRGPAFRHLDEPRFKGTKIDFACWTHGHLDHTGGSHFALPYMANHARFFGAPHTLGIMPYLMPDSRKLSPYLYSKDGEEIDEVLERMAPPVSIGHNDITPDGIEARIAGHTPGALSYYVTLPNGKVVEVSGDRAWHWQWMVCGSTLPDELPDSKIPDSIIMTDFTYPAVRTRTWAEDQRDLIMSIAKSVGEGRPVVVNTYANAKGPGLASALSEAGVTRIYLDGLSRRVLDICLANERWAGGRYPALHTENIIKIKGQRHRQEVIGELQEQGGIVITTSASGEGPSRQYQRVGLHQPRWHFIVLGWTPDESPMGQVQKLTQESYAPSMIWSDRPGEYRIVDIRAKVERFSASGHGDLNDWTTYLAKLVQRRSGEKLDTIIINHCVEAAKPSVKAAIEKFAKRVGVVTKDQRLFTLY